MSWWLRLRLWLRRRLGRADVGAGQGAEGAKAPAMLTSARGFPLRSRGEVLIANWLDARGYRWEYEARLGGFTPDFLLRDEGIVIEYFGMKGKNKKYDAKIDVKKRRYRQEGYRVIALERRHLNRLDEKLRKRLTRPPG